MVLRQWFTPHKLAIVAILFLGFALLVQTYKDGLTADEREKRSYSKHAVHSDVFHSPMIHSESGSVETVVLNMLGASTYHSVMNLRRNSNGRKSENIIVAFSIPLCDQSLPSCQNTTFTIVQQDEANFTVEATLVTNTDLNYKCNKDHPEFASYVKYSGHNHPLPESEPFKNYYILYTCHNVKYTDLVETRNWTSYIFGGLILIVIAALIVVACRRGLRDKCLQWLPNIGSNRSTERSRSEETNDSPRREEHEMDEIPPRLDPSVVSGESASPPVAAPAPILPDPSSTSTQETSSSLAEEPTTSAVETNNASEGMAHNNEGFDAQDDPTPVPETEKLLSDQ